MAATNVLDYTACISAGARKVIHWQRKLIEHSYALVKAFPRPNVQVLWDLPTISDLHNSAVCGEWERLWAPDLGVFKQWDSKGLATDINHHCCLWTLCQSHQPSVGHQPPPGMHCAKTVPLSSPDAAPGTMCLLDTRQSKLRDEATQL